MCFDVLINLAPTYRPSHVIYRPLIAPFGRLATRSLDACQWAGWCEWSACGAECGADATRSRTRECACGPQIDPTSRGCIGDEKEIEHCGPAECPEQQKGNVTFISLDLTRA